MFQATMRCNLWDLVDEGIDEVLDRLKGEAGITGISVPLVCPPVEQLRPHKGVSPRTFRSRGGAQFQPHAEFYANTRLRPVVAEWLKKSNPLQVVAEACAKRGLSLRGEVNCCHSPVMVEKYPFAAVKDVFGEQSPTLLCLINSDVQQYVRGLLSDIRGACDFKEVEFAGLREAGLRAAAVRRIASRMPERLPFESVANALRIIDHLMDICFCESCRQHVEAAGIDAAGVVRAVQGRLEQLFASGETTVSIGEFTAEIHQLEAYKTLRHQTMIELSFVSDSLQDKDRSVQMELVAVPDSANLVRLVSEMTTEGVQRVIFSDYGWMPLARLAWIKQAVRKAQRDVE